MEPYGNLTENVRLIIENPEIYADRKRRRGNLYFIHRMNFKVLKLVLSVQWDRANYNRFTHATGALKEACTYLSGTNICLVKKLLICVCVNWLRHVKKKIRLRGAIYRRKVGRPAREQANI